MIECRSKLAALCTAFAVCLSVHAMPIGLRMAMWGAAAEQSEGHGEEPVVDVVVEIESGKTVAVPQTWLDKHSAIVTAAGGDKAKALNATAANGRLSVAECYVLGLDPENETNDFKIVSFPMGADGKPDLERIVFEPAEGKWNVTGARAVLKGAETVDGDWHEVDKASEADRAKMRFYKVVVELP